MGALLLLWEMFFNERGHAPLRCNFELAHRFAALWAQRQMRIQLRLLVAAQLASGYRGAQFEKFLMPAHRPNASFSHRISACGTPAIACSIRLGRGVCGTSRDLDSDGF